VVGHVGDREILTVNAAAGSPVPVDAGGVWVDRPDVPGPDDCPPRVLPGFAAASVFDRIDVRLATGRSIEEIIAGDNPPGDPTSALWARVPGHLEPSAASLAILGDYVTGGVSQPIGRRVMSRSLDNTLRMVHLEPTEWVLCDIRMQALVGGYAQGIAYLWSEGGSLLATASQSMSVRLLD
jgi:acyl-CoA thioesterase-2